MKKGKGKQQLTKGTGQGVRLCPAGTMANLYRSKQLKQRQEREAMTLVKDNVFDPQRKNENHQLQDKHQNEDRVLSEVPLEKQHLQEEQQHQHQTSQRTPSSSVGSISDYLRMKQLKQQNNEGSLGQNLYVHQSRQSQSRQSQSQQFEGQSVSKTVESACRNEDIFNHEVNSPKKRKTRGLTMLKELQTRSMEERVPILLNERNQPVGPDEKILTQFSSFLGTIARKPNLAPLNYVNWARMPTKEQIWEFVNTIFIVPDEGKAWVLKTVGDAWRTFKHRVKGKYYEKYENDEERWNHRPDYIPEDVFADLLAYWDLEATKAIAERNKENRHKQKHNHTVGRKSFARLYNQIQKVKGDEQALTIAEMFVATRKRKEGHQYKQPDDEVKEKITRIEELQSQENTSDDSLSIHDIIGHMGQPNGNRLTLYGRGVKPSDLKRSGDGKSEYKIPGECIESIKQSLEQEMQQRLNAEKALIEQEMEYKFDQKLQAKEAAMHTMMSQFLAQLGQVNPSLNINTKMVTSLFPLAQSPGDIPNTSNQQSNKGLSSMEIHDDEQQDFDENNQHRNLGHGKKKTIT